MRGDNVQKCPIDYPMWMCTDICLLAAEKLSRTGDISWTRTRMTFIRGKTILAVDDTITYVTHWNTTVGWEKKGGEKDGNIDKLCQL